MRIERVVARAFGPFSGQSLDLDGGLNVIYGPNEAGKSSWHAAIYAGLCGMRRARGAPTREERAFIQRHRPWHGPPWTVALTLALADGRRVELRHNLEDRVDVSATELPLGRDVAHEIQGEDGGLDGAIWLGLDRRSFLSVASVRQAQVQAVRADAEALQELLQRAAASAIAGSTAAEAIEVIEAFRADFVGTPRAWRKPLVATRVERDRARGALEAARADHEHSLALEEQVDAAARACEDARADVALAAAAHARLGANALAERLAEARALAARFRDGEPTDDAAQQEIAERVASALDGWERRPSPLLLDGEPAATLAARLQALPALPGEDDEVHGQVEQAAESCRVAAAVLAEHERQEPDAFAVPDARGLDANALRALAADLERPSRGGAVAGARVPAGGHRRGPIVAGALALGAAATAAAFALAGPPAAAAAAIATAVVAVLLTFLLRERPGGAPVTPVEAADPAATAGAEPARRGLPADSAALRSLADALDRAEYAADERARWGRRRGELRAAEEAADGRLRAALAARALRLEPGEPVLGAFERYRDECRQRRDRGERARTHRARVEAEARAAEVQRQRAAAAHALHAAAMSAGVVLDGAGAGADAAREEDLLSGLGAWRARREQRLQELRAARHDWERLQVLLGGDTLAALEQRATDAERAARERASGLDPALLAAVDLGADADGALQRLRDTAAAADTELQLARQRAEDHARRMPPVAEAEEALAAAEREHARVAALDEVLTLTETKLREAEERAHRDIAPVLQATLRRWLPVVTLNRYLDAMVDPKDLAVSVCSEGGAWRDAGALSHGTAEQIYLLLRVALVEHLGKRDEPCPLLLDDVTVQADAKRTRAILDALAEIARERQVILFSQEDEVLQWARAQPQRARLAELPALPPAS